MIFFWSYCSVHQLSGYWKFEKWKVKKKVAFTSPEMISFLFPENEKWKPGQIWLFRVEITIFGPFWPPGTFLWGPKGSNRKPWMWNLMFNFVQPLFNPVGRAGISYGQIWQLWPFWGKKWPELCHKWPKILQIAAFKVEHVITQPNWPLKSENGHKNWPKIRE